VELYEQRHAGVEPQRRRRHGVDGQLSSTFGGGGEGMGSVMRALVEVSLLEARGRAEEAGRAVVDHLAVVPPQRRAAQRVRRAIRHRGIRSRRSTRAGCAFNHNPAVSLAFLWSLAPHALRRRIAFLAVFSATMVLLVVFPVLPHVPEPI
jgi:hypothetical protein